MSEALLPYYRTELAFIRDLAAQFAETYPNVATSLKLNRDAAGDPHVERLIEAVAFLNARLRHKLDDEFPELTDALLGVLYPHYLAPIPSMSIVQLHLDKGQADRPSGHAVPAGRELESEMVDGQSCRFNTCYPVHLYPIEVAAAALSGPRAPAGRGAAVPAAPGLLRLELRCLSRSVTFAQLGMDRLRFFLHGQGQHVLALYELLLNHVTAITVSDPDGRAAPAVLGPEHIVPVGFEPGEGMLPYPARSLPGYRLLSEYFAFPEKFLFVEIEGLRERLAGAGRRVEICVHLDRAATALEKAVTPDTFRLGCTPVVNLFRQRAEPIRLSHEQAEYHVVPDARRTHATEIYSIERVTATLPDGTAVEHLPFYSVHHGGRRAEGRAWWLAARGGPRRASGEVGRGREVYLSLVDLEHSPALTAGAVIDVETICLNRDLPARLPFGAGRPRLQMTEGGVVARVECLRPPTPTRRPSSRDSAAWRLVSHLSLNHLSITGEDGAAALREILRLYDAVDSQDTRSRAAGLLAVRTRRVTARVGRGAAAGFCRGMEVTLELDEEAFPDNGMFLFACVLERFLGLYCSINSFVAAVATTKQRGQIRRWPPRAGETVVI